MGKYDAAKEIIRKSFPEVQLLPQEASDWQGPFMLPEEVMEYYREFGPSDVAMEHMGSTVFMPSLSRLWEHQGGYRYNLNTKEVFPDWDDDWLVIADEGADPFIYVRSSGQIFHDWHGGGSWDPKFFCENLETVVTVLATSCDIVHSAGGIYAELDDWYPRAVSRFSELLGNEIDAKEMMGKLGWGEWK